jgi:hypothetical protein
MIMDASMDKPNQQHELKQRKDLDEGRRMKMRKENKTMDNNHNDTNSNSTSSSLPTPSRRRRIYRPIGPTRTQILDFVQNLH